MSVKKLFLSVLMICLLSILGYNSILAEITTVPQEKKELQQLAETFLDNYYTSLLNSNYRRCSNVIDNDNTYLWDGFAKMQIETAKIRYNGMHSYKYEIGSKSFHIEDKIATGRVEVYFEYLTNRDFSKGPDNPAAIGRIPFKFTFERSNGQWLIGDVDIPGLDTLELFKNLVAEIKNQKSTSSVGDSSTTYRDAVDTAVQRKIKTVQKLIELEKEQQKKESDDLQQKNQITNDGATEIVPKGSYSYTHGLSIAYAHRYSVNPNKETFLYCEDEDCTNFVSQCIWAGYGIYKTDILQTTLNTLAANRARMSDEWYATKYGATNPWAGVSYLCNYLTSDKTYGPKANLANDGKPYSKVGPSSVYLGNILQFRSYGNKGDYQHSVIVVFKQEPATGWDDIKVAQHSYDLDYRPLCDLIDGFSGFDSDAFPCDMRILRLKPTSFLK